jgi:hypothetical protein
MFSAPGEGFLEFQTCCILHRPARSYSRMISLVEAAIEGRGVYSVADAARYARMPPATIRGWFFPKGGRQPIRRGDIASAKALSFLDFVEALAVRSLRVDYKVSLCAIRQAMDVAQTRLGVDHIFARREHQIHIDSSKALHITLGGEVDPIQISGKLPGQQSSRACLEIYMKDLEFDEAGLARLYTAFRFGGARVVMNPAFNFGEPVMRESGYPALVLWRAVVREGGIEPVAQLYDASEEEVEAAYRYCNCELGMAA